jgi:hypothetical protein
MPQGPVSGQRFWRAGKGQRKRGAVVEGAAHGNVSIHRSREVPADREAEPDSFVIGLREASVHLNERLENSRELAFRDPGAGVDDIDAHDRFGVLAAHGDAPSGLKLHRVSREIQEDLLEFLGIGANEPGAFGTRESEALRGELGMEHLFQPRYHGGD